MNFKVERCYRIWDQDGDCAVLTYEQAHAVASGKTGRFLGLHVLNTPGGVVVHTTGGAFHVGTYMSEKARKALRELLTSEKPPAER